MSTIRPASPPAAEAAASDSAPFIDSQRHLFDMPREVAWLNCAYMSPLLIEAAEAGKAGIARKARPWTITPPDFFSEPERVRALFARIVNAEADDIAIVPSASYGMAVAAKNLPCGRGQEIVVLEDQFPSNYYIWARLAAQRGATVRTVPRAAAEREGGEVDWAAAILEAIGPATAIVALPHCHWTDGSLVDLVAVGQAARAEGAALALDLTQSAGALPFDVTAVQPDFAVAASYKWLLGPYSLGFLYVAPQHRGGVPLEENWITRAGAEDFARLVDYTEDYQSGARRFDMGERSNFHLMPAAEVALTRLLDWGIERIAATLAARNREIARRAREIGLEVPGDRSRAPHYLGLRAANGLPRDLPSRLAADNVFVSVRGESVRVTPHLWTDDVDVDRFFGLIGDALA